MRNRLGGVSAKQAEELSQPWRPWRSSAVLHLWRAGGGAPPVVVRPSAPQMRGAPTGPARALTDAELATRQKVLEEQRKEAARREAERGTFDPTYVVYALGRLMLQKLRRDWQDEQDGKPTLRAFHDALLAHGAAPFWALRRLMLREPADALLE